MRQFRRRLPHVYPEGAALFLTWHLHGSLPKNRYPPPNAENAGKAFVWMDRYLDTARTGPLYLRQDRLAQVVAKAILAGAAARRHYDLHAWAIMPNHVHLLATPQVHPSLMMRSLKGTTALECNRLLGQSGPFWQHESYDRAVRSSNEFERIRLYIEQNPVTAGLVADAPDWPWSSASKAP